MKLILIFALLSVAVFAQETIPISQEVIIDPVVRCPPPTSEEQILCHFLYYPVCSHRDFDPTDTAGVTIRNSCVACFEQGYNWYTIGACEDAGEGESGEGSEGEVGEGEGEGEWTEGGEADWTWCEVPDQSATDIICTLQYEPVCAYNVGGVNGVTRGNACQACLQDRYDYYTNGECAGTGGNEEDDIVESIPVEVVDGDVEVL